MMRSRLAWVAGSIIALGLIVGQCKGAKLSKLKQDAIVLDSTRVRHSRTLKTLRQRNDTAMPDTCKSIVKNERQAADNVIRTDSLLTQNLKTQVALLQPPRLKLFAEADYGIPAQAALLKGDLNVRAGLMLRVSPSTWAYAARQQPLAGTGIAAWHVGVRKEFRLF